MGRPPRHNPPPSTSGASPGACIRLTLALMVLLALGGCQESVSQRTGTPDSGGPLPPPQTDYDVGHYDLSVQVFPDRQSLRGHVTVRAAVTDTLRGLLLDLDERLAVDQARWLTPSDSSTLPTERRAGGDRLWVDLPTRRTTGDTVQVRVSYHGTPRVAPNPPWDGGVTWATTPGGAPWIATSCQTIGADVWWPVKDHPSDEPDSMDIALTVPDTLVAASNGTLRGVDRASDSTRTFRWHVSTPINTYNVAMNVAPYVRIDTSHASVAGTEVPVRFYALPSDSTRAAVALPGFLDQLRFLEKTLGPYPPRADKYGVAQTPFLGMEHQSLIAYGHTFSDGGLGYDAPFDALHFHELAHEWYGNLVTARDWKDFWLHEGPATYLEALYAEHLRDDGVYHAVTDYYRDQMAGGVPIARRDPTSAQAAYHRDVYYRGALTLHTLRYVVGADALRALLRRFAYPEESAMAEPPFRPVTTQDFIETAEAVTGRSLDAFFEVYLFRASLPALETTRSRGTLTLRWTGTGDVSFEVPVPVRVDDTVRRVPMSNGTGRIAVPSDATVTVDPKEWVLRR